MVIWLLLGIGLYYIQIFTPSTIKMGKMGVWKYMGNREDDPDLSGLSGRLERAAMNMKENFPVFVALSVAILALGFGDEKSGIVGAQMFVGFRLAFVVLYGVGIPILRSVAWTGAFMGLLLMVFTLIDKLEIV